MLLELNIENFAIINNANIRFSNGFNVLTGETGAGKSIIIDAVSLILGERANKEFIRTGSESSVVQAVFLLDKSTETSEILKEYGIEIENDNTLLITREIYTSGRSISRVNGRTVTLNMLKRITSNLIDIHGQHQHQSLLNTDNHVDFIDLLGKKNTFILKDKILKDYNKIISFKNKLKDYEYDEKERERKIDLLKFQIDEINNASLKIGEEEELEHDYKLLGNAEKIKKDLFNVTEVMNSSDYNNTSVLDQLNSISSVLSKIANLDINLQSYKDSFDATIFQLHDIIRDLRDYGDNVEYDSERLRIIEDRIDLINNLKRKYGNTIEEILQYRDEITSELEFIINSEKEINTIKDKIFEIEKSIYSNCNNLTIERKKIALQIEKDITKELEDLNMPNVSFKIKFDCYDKYTKNGIDKIEFMISTNIGEPLKPLSRIVSGGEMSRIMLAFKTILAHVDNISTLIFDEIDTGISGRTAQIISEKIDQISVTHQILCITHLPQIAAMGDTHFLIDKQIIDSKTSTKIIKLSQENRIVELSRLLGGVDLTDTTKQHAKEMLDMSKNIKQKWL